MNLVNVAPGIQFDRPPSIEEVGGQEGLLVFPAVEAVTPGSAFEGYLGRGALADYRVAARWRQVAFLAEQVGRLFEPKNPDPRNNTDMTPDLAELEHHSLLVHLERSGLLMEEVQAAPVPVAEPAAVRQGAVPRGAARYTSPVPRFA